MGAALACAFAGDRNAARHLRRRTYRRLSDLRTAFQQTLAEPPPASTRAAAWWPVVTQLETVTDAVTEAAVATRAGGPAPLAEDVATCVAGMQAVASQLRAEQPDQEPPLRSPTTHRSRAWRPPSGPPRGFWPVRRGTARTGAGPAGTGVMEHPPDVGDCKGAVPAARSSGEVS